MVLQRGWHPGDRQNSVGQVTLDGALWHAAIVRLYQVLHQDKAALAMNRSTSQRSVRAGSRQDDGDG
jgi:hypothetical protein